MKLGHVIQQLVAIEKQIGPEAVVDLMIEVNEPSPCQYQFESNDIAVSSGNCVIIMHEKWGPGLEEK